MPKSRMCHALATVALTTAVTLVVAGQVSPLPNPAGPRRVATRAEVAPIHSGLRVRRSSRRAVKTASPSSAAPLVPGEVIVKFAPGAPGPVVTELGGELVRAAYGDFSVMALETDADPRIVSRELTARSDVEYAQPNYLRQALFVPDDPFFNLQWNLTQIGMERAWDVNPGSGDTVTVAVVDSGLAYQDVTISFRAQPFRFEGASYPALGDITIRFAAASDLGGQERFVAPFDFVWGDENPVDLDGHGTHVTGTLGQSTDNNAGVAGIAFNVRIMPLKVVADQWDLAFGAVASCCGAADADIADAIHYAVENGADVINMSLGGPEPSPVINDAIAFAVERDVFVAIAGGNAFEDDNPTIWPAAAAKDIDGAMSVAAVDRHSERAPYSSTGDFIEIAAPGGDLDRDGFDGVLQQTLDPDFALTFLAPPSRFVAPRFDVLAFVFFQGTSMATPHVAGLAALLKSQGITSPAAIEAGIRATAFDLGERGEDEEFGAGLIDAAALVRGLGLAR